MIYLNLLMITAIIVFIIDISGFIQEMEEIIRKHFFPQLPKGTIHIPKPFSCSLCLTFWTGILYLIFTKFSIALLAYVSLLAFLTPVIADILMGIKDLLVRITSKIR